MVWTELVDTGGKGLYLGGLKEFEDYASHYYGISPATEHEMEVAIASENLAAYQQKQLNQQSRVVKEPIKIFLSNVESSLAYHLAHRVASGELLGEKQSVAIHLYHGTSLNLCKGLSMELEDLASPLLDYIRVTTSLKEALDSVHIAFLLDYSYTPSSIKKYHTSENSKERRAEIKLVAQLYKKYACTLDFAASKDVKVIVSGCFANTGAAIMAANVSSLPPSSFVAAPSLAESQSKSLLARHLSLNASDVSRVVIWGRTHGSVLVDTSCIRVAHYTGAIMGPNPFTLPLSRCEFDEEWIEKVFINLLASRHALLSGYKDEGPSLAEAVSLIKLGQGWLGRSGEEVWHSVGVVSDGTMYQVPQGVTFSLPCQCREGRWEVVPGLERGQTIQVSPE